MTFNEFMEKHGGLTGARLRYEDRFLTYLDSDREWRVYHSRSGGTFARTLYVGDSLDEALNVLEHGR